MTMSGVYGLLGGYIADRIWADPPRMHPVSGFGHIASEIENRLWADSYYRGVLFTGLLSGGAGAAAIAVDRLCRRTPTRIGVTAAITWAVLGGASLSREARRVQAHLEHADIAAARRQLRHLVGRHTDALGEDEVCRAVIESVAENTSDAVVAPLVTGALAGIPGLVVYRVVNTLDAMVGYPRGRYRRFGWASARLDDLLNLVPARVTALLAAILTPTIGGSPIEAVRIWRRDAARHPSPNAGPVEAAFAGAMGVRLGGPNSYPDRVEERNRLGDGDQPVIADITTAITLADRIGTACVAAIVLLRALGTLRVRGAAR